jgi:hypothetical protein
MIEVHVIAASMVSTSTHVIFSASSHKISFSARQRSELGCSYVSAAFLKGMEVLSVKSWMYTSVCL